MDYLIVCSAALLVAGLTFFAGFGLGTLLMPVFAIFFPVEVAIAATAMVHLANNFFKVLLVGRHANQRVVLLFAIPGAVAAVLGAMMLGFFAESGPLVSYELWGRLYNVTPVKLLIAMVIGVFAVIELLPFGQHLAFGPRFIPLGGVLSGFLGGLSGHQGALRSAFLVRAGLEKKALVGTMVVSAVVVDMARLVVYGATFMHHDSAMLTGQNMLGLVAAGSLAAFVGSFVGARLLHKMTLGALHKIITVMLILLAAAMALGVV